MSADDPRQAEPPAVPRGELRSRGWTYLLAVTVTTATLGARLAFASWFGGRPALVLFVLPIFLSAHVGGLGPGLISTAVFALGSAYFLMPPIHSFVMDSSVDAVLWLALILIGVLISVLTESLQTVRRSGQGLTVTGTSLATQRKVQGGFGLALALLTVIGTVSVLSVNRMREDTGWATHTEEVISSLRLLLSTVTDVETAERGYLITGEESYLEPYVRARQAVTGEQQFLRKLTADNGVQQRQLDLLEPLISERLAKAEQGITLRRNQALPAPQASRAINEGKPLHDRIRQLLAEMEATEQALLREREDHARHGSVVTRMIILGGGALSFIFVAVALFVMNQEFALRHRTEAALREARDQLEARVRERTAELEQANVALRSSEEIFSNAFRHSPDCLAIVRLSDSTVIRANEAVCQLWGSTPEEVIGKPAREYTNWLSDDERRAFLQTAMERGENLNHETDLRMNDGRLVRFNISSRMISLEGQPCILSVMSDITERRKAELALRATQARLSSTLAAGSIGTWTWNIGTDCLTADEFTARVFSVDAAAAAIGLPAAAYLQAVVAEDQPGVSAGLTQAIQTCGHYDIEYQVRQKDGARLWLQARGRVEGDAAGKAVSFHGAVMDITARKLAEGKVHQLNSELEQRVVERTAQLEAANQELEAFSYSVSHDLRAPLRAVDGFSQAVLEDYGPSLPPDGQRQLQTIRAGAQRMGELLDDLLAFARLSRQPLVRQPVNTGKLVREVLEETAGLCEGRKIEIHVGDLPDCEGDRSLLKQVWINLIANALKYTRRRGDAVVGIGSRNEAGGPVFFVRDNGAGFDMKYAHKLFGVFQRLHRLEDYEGTGVGLAIVQRIIHRHGGRVWAEAAPDRGATFSFTLNGEIKS